MADQEREIIMKGECVEIRRTTVERRVKTEDFLAEALKTQPLEGPILPSGAIWYTRTPDPRNPTACFHIVVVERPAGLVPILYKDGNTPTAQSLKLSWPITQFWFRFSNNNFHDLSLTASRQPLILRGRDTELLWLSVPNQYERGNFCLGNSFAVDVGLPFNQKVGAIMTYFDTSLWNRDLMPQYDTLKIGIDSLEDWHAKSAVDPELHGKITWKNHPAGRAGNMISNLARRA